MLLSRWIRFGWFVTGIVGIAVVFLMAVRESGQASADAWVDHTLEVVGAVEETKSDFRGASNELRGYVLTGQAPMLEAYHRHLGLALRTVSRTQQLLQDNPEEADRANRLADEIKHFAQSGDELLVVFRTGGLPAAAANISTGQGEAEQATLDQLANAMLAEERGLLRVRQELSVRLRRAALWLESVLGVLVTAQIVASGYLFRARYQANQREQETLRLSQAYSESIVATIRQPLMVLDSYLRVVSANRAYYQLFQTAPAQIEGLPLTEIAGGMWNIPELIAHLHSILDEHEQMEGFPLLRQFAQLGTRR